MAIHFHIEPPLKYALAQKRVLKKWLKTVVSTENADLKTLNYIFCNDVYLHRMNVEYLNHDTLTDVITFDNSDTTASIEGDIFISIDRIKDNALKYEVPTKTELRRVLVHGLLHLLGYRDKTAAEQQQMRAKENTYLALFEKTMGDEN